MSDDPALATEFVVAAQLRRSNAMGTPAFLVRRGEGERGTVLVRLNRLNGTSELFSQITQLDGSSGWMPALNGAAVPDGEADAYVQRAIGRDPDLWVVEIETASGGNPFA